MKRRRVLAPVDAVADVVAALTGFDDRHLAALTVAPFIDGPRSDRVARVVALLGLASVLLDAIADETGEDRDRFVQRLALHTQAR